MERAEILDEFPIWSRNGHELFFLTDNRIMVARYTANGDSFVPDKPRMWSEKRLLDLGSPPVPTYDAAPDGKHFAVVLYPDGTADEKPIAHVTFLLNFFDERQSGYLDDVQKIILEPGEQRLVVVTLKLAPMATVPNITATLKLNIKPNRAAVFLDEKYVGHSGELEGHSVR